MPSPFPGMDPYLQRSWGDVHTSLCAEIRTTLQPNLPSDLRARVMENVIVEDDSDQRRLREPDVAIVSDVSGPTDTGFTLIKAPLHITIKRTVRTRRWVQIIDISRGSRVVTAIGILSPSNKRKGKGNIQYMAKLDDYFSAGVNVVEIDLIRSSRRNLIVTNGAISPAKRAAYYTTICVGGEPEHWSVYPMPLREKLPTVLIPCRDGDDPVAVPLQELIDRIYVEGGHDDIDYSQPHEPAFEPDDAAWAATLTRPTPS